MNLILICGIAIAILSLFYVWKRNYFKRNESGLIILPGKCKPPFISVPQWSVHRQLEFNLKYGWENNIPYGDTILFGIKSGLFSKNKLLVIGNRFRKSPTEDMFSIIIEWSNGKDDYLIKKLTSYKKDHFPYEHTFRIYTKDNLTWCDITQNGHTVEYLFSNTKATRFTMRHWYWFIYPKTTNKMDEILFIDLTRIF